MKLQVLLCLLFLHGATFAQATKKSKPKVAAAVQCNVSLSQSPTVRGFRLGMSVDAARKEISSLRFSPISEFGEVKAYYSVFSDKIHPNFNGIQTLRISFFEDKLYSLFIRYNNEISWHSSEQFTASISQSLKLPKVWQVYGSGDEAIILLKEEIRENQDKIAVLLKTYTEDWPEVRLARAKIRLLEKELDAKRNGAASVMEKGAPAPAVIYCDGWRIIGGMDKNKGVYLHLVDKNLSEKYYAAIKQAEKDKRETWKP